MAAVHETSTEFAMTLSEEERAHLLKWLEQRLKDKLIEEHRTDALNYKEHILHEEAILKKLIDKLRRSRG
jgi:hypothetical protein